MADNRGELWKLAQIVEKSTVKPLDIVCDIAYDRLTPEGPGESEGKEVREVPEVMVERVQIPPGCTIGFGVGRQEDGSVVLFAGDHRMMRALGEAVQSGETPIIDPPEWAVLLRIRPEGDGR